MFSRLSLFHRVFLHGVLLIIAFAVAVIITFHAVDDMPNNWIQAFGRAASLMSNAVAPRGASQSELEKQIQTLALVTRASLAVYTEDGVLLAKVGDLTSPALTADEANALLHRQKPYRRGLGEIYAPIPAEKEPAYLAVSMHAQSGMLRRFLIGLFVVLLVIGAMSVPVARSIAQPIQSITRTARRLKDGDLDARVEINSSGELGILASALNDMASGLKARILREKELLANVSHELRTPLTRMRLALDLAAEPAQNAASTKRHLDEIATDITELDQLVSDVLSAVRLDLAGSEAALPLCIQETSLSEILNNAAARFSQHRDRPLQIELPADVPPAKLDKALILRVIGNLLDNADKYSKPGEELSLALYMKDNDHIVEVRDRGEGIPEADLQRIFEPFYRCDKSRSKDVKGLGLGLTLAKRIAEAHGGDIVALPREDGGTIMRVRIPV